MWAYFIFYFIKISFPVHFLFKWRQYLSAWPHMCIQLHLVGFLQQGSIVYYADIITSILTYLLTYLLHGAESFLRS